jgi:uncharacterized membrane protein (UPF0182 family)
VRPWYVQAEQTPIPQLNYVVVSYGDQVFRARTLEGALTLAFPEAQVDFSTTVGPLTPLGPAAGAGEDGEAAPPATDNSSEQPPGTGGPESVGELLAQANTLYAEAQTALEDGDLGTYQTKINEAFALVQQAEQLSGVTGTTEDTAPDTSPDTTAST